MDWSDVLAAPEGTRRRLAFLVWLERRVRELGGVSPLLVGGAAVEIHTQGGYMNGYVDLKCPEEPFSSILAEVGFLRKGRVGVHPDADLWVDRVGEALEAPYEIASSAVELRLLADFDAHADALFGRERREWSPSRFWRAVERHGEFFATMPWLPEGRTLWRAIGGHATILTALPRTDQEKVRAQKVAWCQRELGPLVPVICVGPEQDKSEWCSPGALLIDDRERNCARWRAAGGVALHFGRGSE